MKEYEDLTLPVKVRLGAIGAATRLTHGETRDLYLPMAEAELAISQGHSVPFHPSATPSSVRCGS